MRILTVVLAAALLLGGCGQQKQRTVITIDNIRISAGEFEEAYRNAKMTARYDLSRREFLDMYIMRKLMLKEGETLGLDKDPRFLENLQIFWEQALLKFVLARKANELAVVCRVSDEEIEEYYQSRKDTDFAGKDLNEVREQIRVLLFKIKNKLELSRWTDNLKRKATIKINYEQLNIPTGK
jgi:hypothetical protein